MQLLLMSLVCLFIAFVLRPVRDRSVPYVIRVVAVFFAVFFAAIFALDLFGVFCYPCSAFSE